MKKFLKFLGVVLLLVIAFLLIAGLFISRSYHFERSISIRASQEEVWQHISLFGNFEHWDPWKEKDSLMVRTITGTDGMAGTTYTWTGNSEVGSGSQTFRTLHPYEHITIDLQFTKPFQRKAVIFYHLQTESKGTLITWGFDTKIPYPFNALTYFFMDMDGRMNKDFSTGLANLKRLCERGTVMTACNNSHPQRPCIERLAQRSACLFKN